MSARVPTDELWRRLEPLIPTPPHRCRFPGRRRVDNRAALESILVVARTGMRWNDLPTAMFGASGATCWRRLNEWYEAGVWQGLHETLLAELRTAGLLGSKHHLITDATGTPLAVILSGGNRNDVTQLPALIDAIPPIRGVRGRPRRRPRKVDADRGDAHHNYRQLVRQRGITPVIAHRGTAHGSDLGRLRWVVERTFAWLHACKRLRIRSERRADIHQAMLSLVCSIICVPKPIRP